MTSNAILKIIISLSISCFLISCSSENSTPKTQMESVKERAVARWNALIEKDWTTAYSYESPNYRKNYSKGEFINSFGQAVTWVSIKHLSSHSINTTLADVKLELTFNYDMSGNLMKVPSNITERWQLIDNKWWHIKK